MRARALHACTRVPVVPAGSAGFECGFGLDSLVSSKIGRTRVPVVPAGSAGFECVFGLDSLVYSKIGHTHTHTHTQTNKTLSIFPPALAPTRPGLPCVYTHTSLDLTALDPYGDQNNAIEIFQVKFDQSPSQT